MTVKDRLRAARDYLKAAGREITPHALVETAGVWQINDPDVLRPLVEEICAKHPSAPPGWLVGQVLRSEECANPAIVAELVKQILCVTHGE